MSAAKQIRETLQPLFRQAREEGTWLYTNYQNLWFSPNELDTYNASGRFIWGVQNWKLRNPEERICELEQAIENAKTDLVEFQQRVKASLEPTP